MTTVKKYIKYYRQQIMDGDPISQPLTDYSHPFKIFGTLMSLALVLRMDEVDELRQWNNGEEIIKRMFLIGGGNKDLAICLFKVVIHHYSTSKSVQELDLKRGKKWW